ncbi:hypothetical protein [Bradyrhizobium japonicum]|uniref:hypothetical protein n=1 Tax=Bradyrhizobium japonicum TaxID=375 RepID=UPI001E5ECDEC|nr:hypothetical protein [Bradyrhizobium japonicum]MCD9817621.1 hypothetical protein [Bradyrhizobium japonicum]MEB2672536.1 hypothetical protein [Bradyrhizobium japonicum]WRI91797.1 hypothetical protein R3F75_13055 [Bradyrhizobium japonicum]
MKIPKGADIQLKTESGLIELHVTAALTTRTQAAELIAAIRQISGALEVEKRGPRKKTAAVAGSAGAA